MSLSSQPDGSARSVPIPSAIRRDNDPLRILAVLWQARWLLLLVPLCSIALVLWLAWTKAPQLPTGDEWSLVSIYEKFSQGSGTFADLWRTNGQGHRLLWPRLIALPVVWLTSWDRQVMLTVSITLAVITWVLLMDAVRRTFEAVWAVWVLLVPTALLAFSQARYHNWLKSYTDKIPTALGVAIVVWAIAAARPGSRGWYLVALLGAVVASYSSLAGLAAWFAFFPAVFERSRKWALIWIMAGVLTIGVFAIGYPFGEKVSPVPLSGDYVRFVLAWFGVSVGQRDPQRELAAGIVSAIGIVGALVFLYWPSLYARASAPKWLMVWFGLAAFAAGTGTMIAMEKAGPEDSEASRYLAYSVVWWIAFLVIGLATTVRAMALAEGRSWRARSFRTVAPAIVYLGIVLLVMVGTIKTSAIGLQRGIAWQQDQLATERCVFDQPVTQACLASLGTPKKISPSLEFLRQEHLAIFR